MSSRQPDPNWRQPLPHQAPLWIDPARAVFFVTVCSVPRGCNQLATPTSGRKLIETISHRNNQGVWHAHLALLMPDHVHLLLSFPPSRLRNQMTISKWKEWTAKSIGIAWQRDFFEHRLRREESLREKADSILANPVRAGLVARADAWPYVWFPDGKS